MTKKTSKFQEKKAKAESMGIDTSELKSTKQVVAAIANKVEEEKKGEVVQSGAKLGSAGAIEGSGAEAKNEGGDKLALNKVADIEVLGAEEYKGAPGEEIVKEVAAPAYLDKDSDEFKDAVVEAVEKELKLDESIRDFKKEGDSPWKLISYIVRDREGYSSKTEAMVIGRRNLERGVLVKVSERDGGKNDVTLQFLPNCKLAVDSIDDDLFTIV